MLRGVPEVSRSAPESCAESRSRRSVASKACCAETLRRKLVARKRCVESVLRLSVASKRLRRAGVFAADRARRRVVRVSLPNFVAHRMAKFAFDSVVLNQNDLLISLQF